MSRRQREVYALLGVDPDDDSNGQRLRVACRKLSTPALDALREALPYMATSIVIGYLANPRELMDALGLRPPAEGMTDPSRDDVVRVTASAMMAISDELDVRIPPRFRESVSRPHCKVVVDELTKDTCGHLMPCVIHS